MVHITVVAVVSCPAMRRPKICRALAYVRPNLTSSATYLSNHWLGIELWLLMISCGLLRFSMKHVVDDVEHFALFAVDVMQSSLRFANLADNQVVL